MFNYLNRPDAEKTGLNAAQLRSIAMTLMLLDHIGATIFPNAIWMRIIGRLAFPIFAFQITEGYLHTQNFRKYCLRLLLFALITEIPFDLMLSGSVFYPLHQNVLFTLLFGLLFIRQLDKIRSSEDQIVSPIEFLKTAVIILASSILLPDYGALGVFQIAAFFLTKGVPSEKCIQLLMLSGIHIFGYGGPEIVLLGNIRLPIQAFAICSLFLIWRYNGEKGPSNRKFQLASYAFYPAHMLMLWILTQL